MALAAAELWSEQWERGTTCIGLFSRFGSNGHRMLVIELSAGPCIETGVVTHEKVVTCS
jgi:hypothetical protein